MYVELEIASPTGELIGDIGQNTADIQEWQGEDKTTSPQVGIVKNKCQYKTNKEECREHNEFVYPYPGTVGRLLCHELVFSYEVKYKSYS